MNYQEITTQDEFDKAREEFKAKNPAFKDPKPIECLNLLLRKEFALQIINGEKKVEFRAFSEHYCSRLIDNDASNWMQDHIDDKEAMYFASEVRPVKKIHFHNYNNTWSLDVECVQNDYIACIDKDVSFLQSEYNCHELDKQLETFNKKKELNRPLYFYFALGDILQKTGF